jgi:hypothetical protein
MEYDDNTLLFSSDAILMIIALVICVECAKEPEYRCERCDKLYKQESRYNAHILKCLSGDTRMNCQDTSVGITTVGVTVSDFSELLRQNREMMEIMRKQQETIQLLVAQIIPVRTVSSV